MLHHVRSISAANRYVKLEAWRQYVGTPLANMLIRTRIPASREGGLEKDVCSVSMASSLPLPSIYNMARYAMCIDFSPPSLSHKISCVHLCNTQEPEASTEMKKRKTHTFLVFDRREEGKIVGICPSSLSNPGLGSDAIRVFVPIGCRWERERERMYRNRYRFIHVCFICLQSIPEGLWWAIVTMTTVNICYVNTCFSLTAMYLKRTVCGMLKVQWGPLVFRGSHLAREKLGKRCLFLKTSTM